MTSSQIKHKSHPPSTINVEVFPPFSLFCSTPAFSLATEVWGDPLGDIAWDARYPSTWCKSAWGPFSRGASDISLLWFQTRRYILDIHLRMPCVPEAVNAIAFCIVILTDFCVMCYSTKLTVWMRSSELIRYMAIALTLIAALRNGNRWGDLIRHVTNIYCSRYTVCFKTHIETLMLWFS